jgi:hypothetical protein
MGGVADLLVKSMSSAGAVRAKNLVGSVPVTRSCVPEVVKFSV